MTQLTANHAAKIRPSARYMDVRVSGRLLFKFDPERDVIEIRTQGETYYVDLANLRAISRPKGDPIAVSP